MGLYDQAFDRTWTSLDRDSATERAYALGVAESLGEYHREEFEAIHAEMTTTYDRSLVELAFREGKNEGRKAQPAGDTDEDAVWDRLVEGEAVTFDEDDLPIGGRNGLPEAVDKVDVLDRPTPDDVEATDRPEFLDR